MSLVTLLAVVVAAATLVVLVAVPGDLGALFSAMAKDLSVAPSSAAGATRGTTHTKEGRRY